MRNESGLGRERFQVSVPPTAVHPGVPACPCCGGISLDEASDWSSPSRLKPETRHLSAHAAAFSLIELLVVIVIIAVIAGLLIPAVGKMIAESGRAKAGAQTVAVANAIRAYRTTYSRWPGQTQGAADGLADPHEILNALTNNSRNINFLEVEGGQIADGLLIDPWKRYLEIAIDENDDGNVTLESPWTCDGPGTSVGVTMTTNALKQTVLVMSWGPDPERPDKWVQSWHR